MPNCLFSFNDLTTKTENVLLMERKLKMPFCSGRVLEAIVLLGKFIWFFCDLNQISLIKKDFPITGPYSKMVADRIY